MNPPENMFPQDFNKSILLLEKAAKQGHVVAQHELGGLYSREGAQQNYTKAVEYYQEAYNNGFPDSERIAEIRHKMNPTPN